MQYHERVLVLQYNLVVSENLNLHSNILGINYSVHKTVLVNSHTHFNVQTYIAVPKDKGKKKTPRTGYSPNGFLCHCNGMLFNTHTRNVLSMYIAISL